MKEDCNKPGIPRYAKSMKVALRKGCKQRLVSLKAGRNHCWLFEIKQVPELPKYATAEGKQFLYIENQKTPDQEDDF